MAYNVSYYEKSNPKYPNNAYRLKAHRDWMEAGKKFLESGIRDNPNRDELYFALGWLIQDKFKFNDPWNAIPYLKKAAEFPDAPLYTGRMVGHMYVEAGKTREAYEWWKKLWTEDHQKNPNQLWNKIAKWGREAETKLDIPMKERFFPLEEKSIIKNHAK